MRRVAIGRNGLEVSALCLGTMYFGTTVDQARSFRLLDQYVAAGGTFIDTANIYASWIETFVGGESETTIGAWMAARGCRDAVLVATKMGFAYQDVPTSASATLIVQEVERSLERLRTDRIDLYYIHVDDPQTPLEETLEALSRLREGGKILNVGCSNYTAARLAEALDVSRERGLDGYRCIQQRHSYLRPCPGVDTSPQVVADPALFDVCAAHDVAFLAYSPLIGGLYARADAPLPPDYACPANEARLATLRSIAWECGATPGQVVLAWMMQSEVPAIPLLGVSQPAQLEENLGALDIRLSAELMRRLNRAHAEGPYPVE